jgi:hypothetical protein
MGQLVYSAGYSKSLLYITIHSLIIIKIPYSMMPFGSHIGNTMVTNYVRSCLFKFNRNRYHTINEYLLI